MINELTEYSEDARTSLRFQYAVQLTYTDGQVRIHVRENELAARNMVKIHRQMMVKEPSWLVEKATLIVRQVTISLGDWAVLAEAEEEEGPA